MTNSVYNSATFAGQNTVTVCVGYGMKPSKWETLFLLQLTTMTVLLNQEWWLEKLGKGSFIEACHHCLLLKGFSITSSLNGRGNKSLASTTMVLFPFLKLTFKSLPICFINKHFS